MSGPQAIRAALDRALLHHGRVKIREDEMRGCLEEAIPLAAALGDQAACDKLAVAIEELAANRIQRSILDEVLEGLAARSAP